MDLDRVVEIVETFHVERNQRRPPARDTRIVRAEGDPERRPGPSQDQGIAEIRTTQTADVLDANQIDAVGRGIERHARVLGEGGPAVVVDEHEGLGRQAARRKNRAGRMDLDLVHRLTHWMVFGRGLEHAQTVALLVPEDRVVIRIPRQCLDPPQLTSEQNIIIDGQAIPPCESNSGDFRRVIPEGHFRLVDRA